MLLRSGHKSELLRQVVEGAPPEAALRLTVVAWKRRQKTAALFDLDVEIEVLRHLVRKAHRLSYINTHRLDVWMRHVNEIGRIVGAWVKHEGPAAPRQ